MKLSEVLSESNMSFALHLPVLLVIVTTDDVTHDEGSHEAHGVAQGVDDPHQCPGKVTGDVERK